MQNNIVLLLALFVAGLSSQDIDTSKINIFLYTRQSIIFVKRQSKKYLIIARNPFTIKSLSAPRTGGIFSEKLGIENWHFVQKIAQNVYFFSKFSTNSLPPTEESLAESNFDPEHPTIVLSHGWNSNGRGE